MMPLRGKDLYIYLVCTILYPLLSYVSSISYSGCLWKGADEIVRRCYPVLLAFQVDYPEACMLALVRQNHACPTCIARKFDFADLQTRRPERTVKDMTKIFYHARDLDINGDNKRAEEMLQNKGLVNIKV
jgi:Plavaka transposase